MRITGLLVLFFCLISFKAGFALDLKNDKNGTISLEEFQYQRALFYFLTEDYLTSSGISSSLIYSPGDEKNKILLLSKLSDMKTYYSSRGYPSFITQNLPKDQSDLLMIMNAVYEKGGSRTYANISGEIKNELLTTYFSGAASLEQGRLEDALKNMRQIPPGNIFYPYARIALAQINIMKQNLDEAERFLQGLSSYSSIDENLSYRLHLLSGQIFFERGLYHKALNEFLSVPPRSSLGRAALIGQAWCLIELNNSDDAISVIKGVKPIPPYDLQEQSIQIALGHLYVKSGKIKQAISFFNKLNIEISDNDKLMMEILI